MKAARIVLADGWRDEERVMRRLHQIIDGSGDGPFRRESGYTWQVDCNNDWWAEICQDGDDRVLVVACRYRSLARTMHLMLPWLIYVFGETNHD